jgi:hypothetical protein
MAFDEPKPLGGNMIQSAKELAFDIWDFNSESGEWLEYRDRISALIRSRDKAIIDRCKEAINDLPNCNGDPSRGEALDDCIDAIDSVLKEL